MRARVRRAARGCPPGIAIKCAACVVYPRVPRRTRAEDAVESDVALARAGEDGVDGDCVLAARGLRHRARHVLVEPESARADEVDGEAAVRVRVLAVVAAGDLHHDALGRVAGVEERESGLHRPALQAVALVVALVVLVHRGGTLPDQIGAALRKRRVVADVEEICCEKRSIGCKHTRKDGREKPKPRVRKCSAPTQIGAIRDNDIIPDASA